MMSEKEQTKNRLPKEQTKNRLAIAGQVRDAETKLLIPGVLVEIRQQPEEFKNSLDLQALQYGKSWKKNA